MLKYKSNNPIYISYISRFKREKNNYRVIIEITKWNNKNKLPGTKVNFLDQIEKNKRTIKKYFPKLRIKITKEINNFLLKINVFGLLELGYNTIHNVVGDISMI